MTSQINLTDEITVDGFCGGGGWSTGFELAIGRPIDIGINHDADAIAMHRRNHPFTKHYNENIFEVDPYEAVQGRDVGWAHFSPDCTHFSRAKGGTPVKKSIRGLAWVVTKWAGTVRPRIISMENVPEFMTWGPLCARRDKDGRIYKTDGTIAEKHEYVPYHEQKLIPDRRRTGKTFRRFISVMKSLGYECEWRILTASDYGAPTIRKRLFILFRNDGQPIKWPEPTYGDPESEAVKSGRLKPWHTAAECIDWSIPCPSIFERKKPLAENTLKRIAKGIQRFVIDNPKPFIVQVNHSGENFRGQNIDEPMPTLTAKHGFGIVAPPLIQYHGEQSENEVRGQALEQPLWTVDTANRYGLVTAFMSKYFGGNYKGCGSAADEPLHTITATDHNALAAVHITQFNNHCIGQNADEPLNTIACSGGHFGEVQAFLIRYYSGENHATDINEPLGTITTKERFGIVTIQNEDYAIVDIGMRMLTPRELYNAQGFPEDYEIETDCYGKAYPKTKQVARCGNSVPPPFATALVRANAPEWCGKKISTMKEFLKGVAV
ncbi:MAG: DNA cytosine methyltransferase [Candidatus Ornithomonoglobus sp.]